MKFDFIDLFAGIGGMRMAFEKIKNAKGRCVFSSEYDPFAQQTYKEFFGHKPDFSEILKVDPPGDITLLPPEKIPHHDILSAGFPCQPFSLAGVSKKNSLGKSHGFADPTQGTLFFNIKNILLAKEPKAFLLENVKNLMSHDGKKTFEIIKQTLTNVCGYHIYPVIIDAKGWVPQHRERIYIVGFRKQEHNNIKRHQDWDITSFKELYEIEPPRNGLSLDQVLEKDVPPNYIVGPGTWKTLKHHKSYHEAKGHGFGYEKIKPDKNGSFKGKVTRTLSARYHKDGAEILISRGEDEDTPPRRLTPLECCRLMGFGKKYQKYFRRESGPDQPVSDTQAYRQFGNSVVVPVVSEVARVMIDRLISVGAFEKSG